MTAPQTDASTDPQSIIAALQQRLDVALSEKAALAEALATRNREYGERIEQQSATIDVLKVMSASPGDPQPVFDLIATRARDLCDAYGVAVFEFDGTLIHWRAATGVSDDPTVRGAAQAMFPMAPTREWGMGRAILERRVIRIDDLETEPGLSPALRAGTAKSGVAVPLMRGDAPIGALAMGSREKGGFSDSQVELLKTFAEQAAIAITSADTYRALQTRTSDLQESLEYQTATSDVLKVISRSAFDLQPVLDTVVTTAARLCDAEMASIGRREGDLYRGVAHLGFPEDFIANRYARGAMNLCNSVSGRAAREGRIIHVHDVADDPDYPKDAISIGGQRSSLGVPLLRDNEVIGVMVLARRRVEPFTDQQIELVRTFADQAVIAIENTRLITEQREALEQQTATAEVLQIINANPGDLTPVFDAILEKAHSLCGSPLGSLVLRDGDQLRAVTTRGYPQEYETLARQGFPPTRAFRLFLSGERFVHILDSSEPPTAFEGDPLRRALAEIAGVRTALFVPLRKDETVLGYISAQRQEVHPFTDRQIALLESFAAQAVIAMENARLLTEQQEALEQQTATAEVLQVINTSPGNLTPVFDAILAKAMHLCGVAFGILDVWDGEHVRSVVTKGLPTALADWYALNRVRQPGPMAAQLLRTKRPQQHADVMEGEGYRTGHPGPRALVDLGGTRTGLVVPLLKDGTVPGWFTFFRQEVRAFTVKEIALLENFAAQAVIAMESARLLDELRQSQAELRVTFENMGDGVAMFDETQHLIAWNRKFQEVLDVPDDIIARRQTFSDYVRYLAKRGEYGADADMEEQVRRVLETAGQMRVFERERPNGRVIEVRSNPVAGGGFVLIYADITERKRSEAEIRTARDAAEEASRTIEAAYRDLKAAQANLIQAEKMASLGQLTAGIAHEIKNPLNFVNNFAALSVDLLDELKETAAPGFAALNDGQRAEIDDVSAMLTSNLQKITEHGKRADGIVKAMLEHSRGSSGERRMVDLNALIDDALNLAYHGARAQDQSFNVTLERDFGAGITPIEVNPQDMTRVFLNLFSNGFYAATKRARNGEDARFEPTLKVTTRNTGDAAEIRVRDNGTGIQADIRDKLFQPFFTTKPTGEGTGLGLSITYDIVTKAHGGSIAVDSKVGDYSEFTIRLPRNL